MFDVNKRESFDLASKWFEEVNHFSDNDPKIILVGNKIDINKRLVQYNEAKELADKYNGLYLEVSALLGTNIEEIFNNLTTDIYYQKVNAMKKGMHTQKKGKLKLENKEEKEEEENKKEEKGGCC